jgi:hypothetical protein
MVQKYSVVIVERGASRFSQLCACVQLGIRQELACDVTISTYNNGLVFSHHWRETSGVYVDVLVDEILYIILRAE